MPPAILGLLYRLLEVGGQKQILQVGIFVERFLDMVQEHSANDAAPAPKQGAITEIQRPVVLDSGGLKLHKTLSVATDLRRIERLADLLDELLAITCIF